MILKPFSSVLHTVLEPEDTYLPLASKDIIKLMSIVPDGEQIILDLNDGVNQEAIIATRECEQFVVQRENPGSRFPRGTTVQSCLSPGVVKAIEWLICNYNCCNEDCPCEAVALAGEPVLPEAKLNQPWTGTFIFTGSLPMNFSVSNIPAWVDIIFGTNYIKLTGTGTEIETVAISVAATNCAGKLTVAQGVINVV